MGEYEVYWLMDFPLINYLGVRQEIIVAIFKAICTDFRKKMIKQIIIRKISNFTVNKDQK